MAEQNTQKLRIRLHVYDTDIPVNVEPDAEPLYRDAASLITRTVNAYAQRYKGPSNEKQLLYMAMIEIALRYEMEKSRNDTAPYEDLISKLTAEIEHLLEGNNVTTEPHAGNNSKQQ